MIEKLRKAEKELEEKTRREEWKFLNEKAKRIEKLTKEHKKAEEERIKEYINKMIGKKR